MENATVEETNTTTEGANPKAEQDSATPKNLEAEEQKRVSARIQEVLEGEGYGLQPFMQYSEFGIVPRVRLVAIKTENNADGQEDNTGDTGETQTEDTDTPAEQPQNA